MKTLPLKFVMICICLFLFSCDSENDLENVNIENVDFTFKILNLDSAEIINNSQVSDVLIELRSNPSIENNVMDTKNIHFFQMESFLLFEVLVKSETGFDKNYKWDRFVLRLYPNGDLFSYLSNGYNPLKNTLVDHRSLEAGISFAKSNAVDPGPCLPVIAGTLPAQCGFIRSDSSPSGFMHICLNFDDIPCIENRR